MKKKDLQNSQQETGSTDHKDDTRSQQKNKTTTLSNNQQNDMSRQAGLGRDLMTNIEDFGGLSGRDDYPDSSKDDLSNKDLNASNDQ